MLLLCLSLLTAWYATASPPFSRPEGREIAVTIHKNVELLGFVYFLGYLGPELENEADAESRSRDLQKYAYGYHLYQQYKRYAGSANLATITGLAGDMGTDYFISLFVQLDDFPDATLRDDITESYYIRFSPTQNPAEARQNAARLIDAMNKLYREVNFDGYLQENRPKYEHALAQVKTRLPARTFIPALEKFYGHSFSSYTLIPSLTLPAGMGFGVRHARNGQTHIFNAFGPFHSQAFGDESQLDMGFADEGRLRELSTHEFGHSFVNPIIDQLPAELITQTGRLYEPIKDAMTRQAYNNWKSCLYEHFVRAGEIILALNLGKRDDAERLRQDYEEKRQFIYLPLLVNELQKYNQGNVPSYLEAVRAAMKKLKLKANAG